MYIDNASKAQPIIFYILQGFLLKTTCAEINGAMGYISKYALANGKPEELLSPVDYDGKLCGVGDYSDYKHLYFLVTVKAVFEPQDSNSLFDLAFSPVCIDQCPVDATSKISCKGTSKINE